VTSLGLSKEDVQSRNKWRRRVKGSGLTEVHLEEMAVKIVRMRACVCVWMCGCVRINVFWGDASAICFALFVCFSNWGDNSNEVRSLRGKISKRFLRQISDCRGERIA